QIYAFDCDLPARQLQHSVMRERVGKRHLLKFDETVQRMDRRLPPTVTVTVVDTCAAEAGQVLQRQRTVPIGLNRREGQSLSFDSSLGRGLPALPENLRFAAQRPLPQRSHEAQGHRRTEAFGLQSDLAGSREILEREGEVRRGSVSVILIVNLHIR